MNEFDNFDGPEEYAEYIRKTIMSRVTTIQDCIDSAISLGISLGMGYPTEAVQLLIELASHDGPIAMKKYAKEQLNKTA